MRGGCIRRLTWIEKTEKITIKKKKIDVIALYDSYTYSKLLPRKVVGLPFPLEEVKNQNDIAPTFCLWNKRSVYCNVVSFGPQFVELHPLNVILCCFVRRNKWIVTNGLIVKKITIGFTLKNNFEKLIILLLAFSSGILELFG